MASFSSCSSINLEDSDKKSKAAMTILEQDGDSSNSSPEIHDNTKPELVHMFEEFCGSYRSLVDIVPFNPDPVADDLGSKGPCRIRTEITEKRTTDNDDDNTPFEMKFEVAKLVKENLQQQAELIKRNDEKRTIIHNLQVQMEQLKNENAVLRNSIECLSGNETKGGKFRLPFFGRLFKKFLHRRLFFAN